MLCTAGGGFCAVRHAQLSAHSFGCSRGKPWGHLSTCGESDTPAQALGGVGRFRFSHLWGGPGEGWQCHQDRPSQLGSALWRHLPGEERTEVRWALAAMGVQAWKKAVNQWCGLRSHSKTVCSTLNIIAARWALHTLPEP